MGQPSPTPSPALSIYDTQLSQTVSDGLVRNTVVGQKKMLQATTNAGSLGNTQWSILGTSIKSQQFSDGATSETANSASDLMQPTLQLYWMLGNGTLTATVTATVANQQQTAVAFFNVEAPSGTMNAKFAVPTIAPLGSTGNAIELGNTNGLPQTAGIQSYYTGSAPKDFGGYFAQTQLFKSNPVTTPATTPPYYSPQTGSDYWADHCAVYGLTSAGTRISPVLAAAGSTINYATTADPTVDAPSYALSTSFNQTVIDDYFEDYLIFRPAGTANAWVAVEKLSWEWGGTATFSSNMWTLTNPRNPAGTSGGSITGTATNDMLSWTKAWDPGNGTGCVTLPSQ